MLLRAHYIIDIITGLIMAHYAWMMAEWVSFVFDVYVVGAPSKERYNTYFKPCKCCGFSNHCASFYMDPKEKAEMKQLYKNKEALLIESTKQSDSDEEINLGQPKKNEKINIKLMQQNLH